MAEVLLINASIKYAGIARGIQHYPPIGLCYLAASLKKAGIRARIIDLGIEPLSIEDINRIIKSEGTKLVGFSVVTPQIHNAMRIIRGIRSAFGDSISIAIGGYHVSNDRTFTDRYPEIDFSLIGDGDISFVQLTKRIMEGEKVKGVFKGEMAFGLDELPMPAYELTPLERYKKMGLDAYPILGTRGCPFDCVFCSRAPMSRMVMYRSPEGILEEMSKYYDEFGGRYIFQDESFSLDRNRVMKFCEAVLKWSKRVYWSAGGVRLDQVDEAMMELMWKAGCRTFFVGIESGSERVRNEIVGKNITDETIFRAFKIMDKFKFEVEISFVLGLPTETEEELKETVYFPLKLKKMGIRCITQVGMKPSVPMPGSRLWDIAIQEGKIPADLIDRYIRFELGEDFWQVWPNYVPDGLTIEKIRELRKTGYLAYYLSPGYLSWRLKKDLRNWRSLRSDLAELWSLIRTGHSTVSITE